MANERDMRLKILACRPVYHGRNQRGDEYDIFEVDAANMQGQKINEKLRSFAPLPSGQEIDVTVTVFNSQKWGKSYTLHPKSKGASGGSTQRINELAELCEQMKQMIALLSDRVGAVEAMVANRAPASAGLMSATASSAELDERFGADPPGGGTW